MKKGKKVWIPLTLSSIILLPVLPLITSCSSTKKKRNPNELVVDKKLNNELVGVINNYVNNLTIRQGNETAEIEKKLLNALNNLLTKDNFFENVRITLTEPGLGEENNFYNAYVEITFNPKYTITIDDNQSDFKVIDNKLLLEVPIQTGIEFYNNKEYEKVSESGLTNVGTNEIKLIGTHPRTPNNEFYSTELMNQYGETYGFVYPGYDHNYETKNGNIFTKKPNAGAGLPETIDAAPLVFNERVNGHPDKKYNDAGWISSEISNNTFKKHPASKNFFANNIDNIDTVEVSYNLSTSVLGSYTLGLFAPPGEVVTITFDDETFNKIKNSNWTSEIVINENFWDNKDWSDSGRISTRYPFLESVWGLNKNYQTLKFGSPFGGGITIRINNNLYDDGTLMPLGNSISNIKFKVSGAIPCMFYQDGVTTEKEWENQKKLVKEQKLAPIIQANGPFHSFTLPFTNLNEISGRKIDNLVYPKELFKKWNQYLYLSNYFAGRDLDNNVKRLNMEFCDDIWGGVSAWGGGMTAWCPTRWGVDSFFGGDTIDMFTPHASWGLFHEVNHSFQQDSALFKRRGHGETNQATIFNLSVISDVGRLRSELNYSGAPGNSNDSLAWPRLNNPFITIYDALKRGNNKVDEYTIYSLILFMFGSKGYSDYVRWDVRNHPNTIGGWTGFEEIKTLSNYFRLNLWPAFFDYGRLWNDNWPTSDADITPEQRKVINELATKYPAVDFVANHYACGNYVYNSQINEFVYSGDTIAPWEIEAGKPFVLNLDDFIISTNEKFNWNDVEFDPVTLGGGTLEKIGNKKLKYTPPKDPSIIDEFDISIIPGTWADKPANYVPKYKFKIKMRQVVNEPILTLYEDLSGNNINQNFEDIFSGKIKVKYSQPMAIYNTNKFTNSSAKQAIKIDFNFVAPKDSTYVFKAKWDDAVRIRFDGNEVFKNNSWTDKFNEFQTKDLKKGDVLHIEAFVINTGGQGGFDLQVFDSEGNSINWMKNALIPNYANVADKNLSTLEILNCDKYKYKNRTIDKNVFVSDITSNMNLSDFKVQYYDINRYKLTSKYGNNVKYLNDFAQNYFELWNKDENKEKGYTRSSFNVEFNEPSLVSTLFFGHRTTYWHNARASFIKVLGYENDGSEPVILYDGQYGKEFNDRSKPYSALNLDKPMVVKKLEITAYNATVPPNGQNGNGLIWQWFRCSSEHYYEIKSNISVNDQNFIFSDKWIFRNNDEENYSAFNNLYVVSNNKNAVAKIYLKNSLGFSLVGQANQNATQINIYVNKKKINNEPITIKANQRIDNHVLFEYRSNVLEDMVVEIEHLDNNPFYLNYVMKY